MTWSALTKALVSTIGVAGVLLISAGLLELAVIGTSQVRRAATVLAKSDAEDPPVPGSALSGLTHVAKSPYLAAIVGYAACGFLIDRFGRRPVLFLYYFVGAFFHLWFAEATGVWIYVAIAAVGWVNPGVYGSNGVYVSELYPTHLRATAVGWFQGSGVAAFDFSAGTRITFMDLFHRGGQETQQSARRRGP